MQMFTVIGILGFLLGLLLFAVAIVLSLRKWIKIKNAVKTTGVVMNVETTSGMSHFDSSPRSTLYTPTVRFQTADGRIVDHTPKISNNVNNYKVGEKVPVYYDPQQPENAIAGTAFRLWYPLFVFALTGGFFALIGAFFIFMSQANRVFDLLFR